MQRALTKPYLHCERYTFNPITIAVLGLEKQEKRHRGNAPPIYLAEHAPILQKHDQR